MRKYRYFHHFDLTAALCHRSSLTFFAAWTSLFFLFLDPAFAAPPPDLTVFRIGTFDRSSAEFAHANMKHAAVFRPGTSDPARDWYAAQPVQGIANSSASTPGSEPTPQSIDFVLQQAPAPAYQLHVALLIESPSVPVLRITINASRGEFHLHPELDYQAGDQNDAFNPVYSHADVVFTFPGSKLHPGDNRITLEAVDKERQPVTGATLTYDAVELDREIASAPSAASTATIVPTIFYYQKGDQTEEEVDVFIRHQDRIQSGVTDLQIGDRHYQQTLASDNDFGEERLEFRVDPFPDDTKAQLAWTINGMRAQDERRISPGKQWTLFLVPNIHLDIGYTDYQAKVAAIQSRVIDEGISLAEQHPGFSFSLDGAWPLEEFLRTRTHAEKERVIAAIQKEQIFVPAQYASVLTGFPTAEALIRSLYPSANFSREHHTPFNYANITDVPSYSWSYASILAAAGIHELVAASDNVRAPVLLQGHLHERSPFWWEGPDGQKVLLWYSRHYMQMQFLFGLPPDAAAGHDTLPLFLRMYQNPDYRSNSVMVFGSQVENTDLFPQQAQLAEKWNTVYAYPRLEYAGFHRALTTIAEQFGDHIPTIRGDGGPYWEDGIITDAAYASVARANERRAPAAEILNTIASLVNPRIAPDRDRLNHMWKNIVLMDEHTWTSADSTTDPRGEEAIVQLDVKHGYADEARRLADFLSRNSMATLADSISTDKNSLIVFNTLSWPRSGLITLDLNLDEEVVDAATGNLVPTELVFKQKKLKRVQLMVRDVPAVGYKVLLLRKMAESASADQDLRTAAATTVLEGRYYRVTLDPPSGSISSIYDKELHQELVDSNSPCRFGLYLYVTGGDSEPNSLIDYRLASPRPALQTHSSSHGRLVSVKRTPYGWTATLTSSAHRTPVIETEIRLFDTDKKIELLAHVSKTQALDREAAYFAFPFAMRHPQFQYEIQTGVVNPANDLYAGAGHEWLSVQHWIAAQQNGISAAILPLDAPLMTIGDINRGAWPANFGQRPGTFFSYVMNNYWSTNFQAAQGGDFEFRYVIRSAGSTDSRQLTRLGWEEVTPLESLRRTRP